MVNLTEQIIRESIDEDEPIDTRKESCPFYRPNNSGCNTQLFPTCFHIEGEEYHSCIAYQESINDLN